MTTVAVPTTAGGVVDVTVSCGVASDNGEAPNLNDNDSHNVWNNSGTDSSFGISSPIFLDNITKEGHLVGTLPVPSDQIVTSFSSKSELALNLSVDGKSLTFVGYRGGPGCPVITYVNYVTPPVPGDVNTNVEDSTSLATAGVQKWVLQNSTWVRLYSLQDGLNLGFPYSVPNYPASLNPATGGCRNMTGRVNGDGTVTIWAVTSTLSANGDQGADPNKLVKATDLLSATTLPTGGGLGHFTTVRSAGAGEVLPRRRLCPYRPLTSKPPKAFVSQVGPPMIFSAGDLKLLGAAACLAPTMNAPSSRSA